MTATNTNWTIPTIKNTNWNIAYSAGRHTFGAEYSKTTRIRLGDNVRIGGVANIYAGKNTNWTKPTAVTTSWTSI